MTLPAKTGCSQPRATLCIGLDIAWFGGSASNKSSQFDFIAAALIPTETTEVDFKHQRVELINRDPKSDLLCAAIKGLLKSYKKNKRGQHASPIVFTDVMPHPAQYQPGSKVSRETREKTQESEIIKHHANIFNESSIMDRVALVILAGHRHGSFRKRERMLLGLASDSFKDLCESRKIVTVETKSMFGTNQPWNIEIKNKRGQVSFVKLNGQKCFYTLQN